MGGGFRGGLRSAAAALIATALGSFEAHAAVVANAEAWANLAANTDTSTTISASHTVSTAARTNRLLLVAMVTRFGSDQTITVTSATFGGVGLQTIVTGSSSSTRTGVWLGYLRDSEIPSGSQTLSVTFSSSTSPTGKKLLAATYTGVDQATPVTDSSANTTKTDAPIPFGSQVDYLAGAEVVYVASFGGSSNTSTTEPSGYAQIYTNEYSGNLMTTIAHKTDTTTAGNSPGSTAVDFAGSDANHSLAVAALQPKRRVAIIE